MLKLKIAFVLVVFFSLLFLVLDPVAANSVRSGFEWKYSDPETQGLSVKGLESAWDLLEKRNTRGFLVIRNDFIVFERYTDGYDKHRRHYTASVQKNKSGSGFSHRTFCGDF